MKKRPVGLSQKPKKANRPKLKKKEIDLPGRDETLVKRLSGESPVYKDLLKIGERSLARRLFTLASATGRRKFFRSDEDGRQEFIDHLKKLRKEEGISKVDIIKLLMKFVSEHL